MHRLLHTSVLYVGRKPCNLKEYFHYGCAVLRCAAIVSDSERYVVRDMTTYRSLSLTIAAQP